MGSPDCARTRQSLSGLIDGELDQATQETVRAHIAGCADCQAALDEQTAMIAEISALGRRFRPGEDFRDRLQSALQRQPAENLRPSPERRTGRWTAAAWTGSAAALAASLILFVLAPSSSDELDRDLVDAHIRSLMANHLLDVESSDRHTVKPWFNGRLDIAPAVPDLADAGFPLIGGRLDYVDGKDAAALVYKGAAHPINLFVWSESGKPASTAVVTTRNGYSVMRWRKSGLAYALVSDIDAKKLDEFHHLWAERATQQ